MSRFLNHILHPQTPSITYVPSIKNPQTTGLGIISLFHSSTSTSQSLVCVTTFRYVLMMASILGESKYEASASTEVESEVVLIPVGVCIMHTLNIHRQAFYSCKKYVQQLFIKHLFYVIRDSS
jgi:hypothetical protein